MFFTLAQAVCSCINLNSEWKENMVNPVLEMMFTTPRPWDPINVAGFLLFCNEQVWFVSKLNNGLNTKSFLSFFELITFHIISLLKKGDPVCINTAVFRYSWFLHFSCIIIPSFTLLLLGL